MKFLHWLKFSSFMVLKYVTLILGDRIYSECDWNGAKQKKKIRLEKNNNYDEEFMIQSVLPLDDSPL